MAYSKGMLPGAAARVAAFCSLVLWVGVARAERRPVAVVDLPGDPATEKLATEIAKELGDHPVLRNVVNYAADLRGPLDDEDAEAIAKALRYKAKAEAELAPPNFRFALAANAAVDGEDELRRAAPNETVLALYADLSFVLGLAKLGEKKPGEAAAAFALVHRLAPNRTLDTNIYLPEVIKAFDDAGKVTTTASATLMVKGSGRVWIDGVERGPPGPYEVPIGRHVVWLTGPDRVTRGWRGDVVEKVTDPSQNVAIIADDPASDRLKVLRARLALRKAADPAARASAMRHLAALVGVHDAVLLTMVNDKIVVQSWRDKAPGFSALREVKKERPRELLVTLAPPPRVIVPPPPPHTFEQTPRWYRRRKVQIGTAAGVVLAVGSYVLYGYLTGAWVLWDSNPSFPGPETQTR